MITKLYEYNMYDKRREIRGAITFLDKEFANKKVKFFIKLKLGREFKEFEYNEIIHNITYDDKNFSFKINFKKDDTYIIIRNGEIYFHERYERLPKRVLHKGETLIELIDKIRTI